MSNNSMPEPRTIASGYLAMVTTPATRQQNIQGGTAITGGTGFVTVTLDEDIDIKDCELLYSPVNAPDDTILIASMSGRTITFRARGPAAVPVAVNTPMTFTLRKRGRLR